MSELIESLEKSVRFLKQRYPDGLPLLSDLEGLLETLKSGEENFSEQEPPH